MRQVEAYFHHQDLDVSYSENEGADCNAIYEKMRKKGVIFDLFSGF